MGSEKKSESYGYIQFPLCLLMETYKDVKNGMNLICDFGILNYAVKLDDRIENVVRQLIYDYLRRRTGLQSELVEKIDDAVEEGKIFFDEDKSAYDGTNFEDNFDGMIQLFETDSLFKRAAILNYQIHLAVSDDHLRVKIPSDDKTILRYAKAKEIKANFEGKFGPDVFASCKISMVFSYRDNPREIDLFRAYVGIKSIIGRRNFISTNKPAIVSRMLGCKSKEAFIYYTKGGCIMNKFLLQTYTKYGKRYHIDLLMNKLVVHKYIMYLSRKPLSVIYVSSYMEPEELLKLIKASKERLEIRQRIKNVSISL